MLFSFLQAEKSSWNSIGIFKLSNISGKRRDMVPDKKGDETDMDSDSSDSDEEEEEEAGSGTPVLQVLLFLNVIYIVSMTVYTSHFLAKTSFLKNLQLRKVFHEGCVNRIRAMTQNPHIVASWGDTGHVQVRLFPIKIQ